MEVRTCQHCNKSFEFAEGRVFSNHVRWCENRNCRSESQKQWAREQISLGVKSHLDKTLGTVKTFAVQCHKCGKELEVQEREFQHPKKKKYHCSIQCRNSRPRTEETRKKVSETLKTKYASGEIATPNGGRGFARAPRGSGRRKPGDPRRKTIGRELVEITCLNCQVIFKSQAKAKFCSRECRNLYDRKNLSDIALYRAECRFQFRIKDFPEEFDFDLIRDHGWYKAANNGNNLGGVSRDHMISVRWGFDNGILPSLLRHPANCKLLVHSDNISKHKKCSLTVDELLDRIDAWDKKYPERQY